MSGSTYKVDNIHGTSAIQDISDESKKIKFDLTNITTATTRNITVPDANITLVDLALAQTLTNKTFDADSNTISNIDNNDIKSGAGINATKIADGSVSNTNFQYINNLSSLAVGESDVQTLTNKTFTDSLTHFQDNGDNTKKFLFQLSGISTGNTRTLTVPDANTTLVGTSITQTLSNKTIDADLNTISNIDNSDIKASAGIDASKIADGTVSNSEFQRINSLTSQAVGISDTQTLTNKTLEDTTTYFSDNIDSTKKLQFQLSGISTNTTRTVTIPDDNTTMVGTGATQTITNKTINADSNTITNIDNADIKASAGIDASKLADGSVSNTKFQYINSLTSNVQTQINDHTGDTNNPHSVTKTQVGLGNVQDIKVNFSATTNPTATDDTGSGYTIGSKWVNINNDKEFVCVDNTTSNAIWRNLTIPDRFDAVISTSTDDGDYTSIKSALDAGHKTIFIKKGTYVETNDLVIPDGGILVGESTDETIISLSGNVSVKVDGSGGTTETSGTISYTTDSTTVTGSGTTFTNLANGDYILVGENFMKINSITNNTTLILEKTFRGESDSGKNYIAHSMKTGISFKGFTISDSSGTGLFIRAVRHSTFNSLIVKNNNLNIQVEEMATNSFTNIISFNATTNGMKFMNTYSNTIYACEIYNCDSDGILFAGTTINVILNGLISNNNDGHGINFINTASHVNVLDCIFMGNDSAGVNTESTTGSIIVNNCTLSDNGTFGIDFDGDNNMVANCVIKNNTSHGIQAGDMGMISNNQIEGNGGEGISLNGDHKCVIEGNRIVSNSSYGIWSNSNYDIMTDNYIEGNSYGIYLSACMYCVISNNSFYNNTNHGIIITGTSPKNIISGNILVSNTIGIKIEGTSHDCSIGENLISAHSSHAIQISTNTCIVQGNRCSGNSGNGLVIDSGATNTVINDNNFTGNTGSDITDNGTVDANLPAILINSLDSRSATTLQLGSSIATKLELADTGIVTEVQGNLDVLEGLDVTGNITVTGTVDGRDIATDGSTLDSHISTSSGIHGLTGTVVGTSDTQTLTNKTLTDSTTYFADDVDSTKKLQLQLSSITTSTTRTLTVPDVDTTILGTNSTQTMTNKTINSDNNTITNIVNADIKTAAAIDATKIADGSVTNTEFQYINSLTSNVQTQINDHLSDTSTHGVSGDIVGTTGAQTMTNKTWGDNLDMNSNKITNLAAPIQDGDAVNKGYVDNNISGLDHKASAVVCSTVDLDSNSSISGTITYNSTAGSSGRGQITATLATTDTFTVDGVTFGASENGSRILLKEQTTGAQNGIWTTTISGTSLTLDRATDFDEDAEVTAGAFVFVTQGTMYGDMGLVLATNDPITIGGASGTSLTFTQFSGTGQIVAGTGLTKTGNTVDVIGSATIIANDDDLEVNSSATANQILLSSGSVGTAATFGQLPLGNANAVTGTLVVANGGSGTTTHTSNAILKGNGTSPISSSGVTIDGSNNVSGINNLTITGINKTSDGTEGAPPYTFTSDATSGMYLEAGGNLAFTVDGVRRFAVETDGTLYTPTISYESLVTGNNDIPNKKYVDDMVWDASDITSGIVSVARGGSGAGTFTSGNFLQGNGTSALTATKTVPSGDVVGTTDSQILINKTFTDASTYFQNSSDNTKKLKLQLSGISTSTTRTLTIPNANTTLVGTDVSQTLTNKTINCDSNTITNIDNADIKVSAGIDATKLADGTVSNTEFQYLNTVSSNIQTQINNKVTKTGDETVAGDKTFTGHMAIGADSSIDANSVLWVDEIINSGGILEGIDIRANADAVSAGQYTIRGMSGYASVKNTNYNSGSTVNGLFYGVYGLGTTAGSSSNLDVTGLGAGIFMTNGVTLNVNDAYGANIFCGKDLLGSTGVMNATNAYVLRLQNGNDGLSATNHYGLYVEEPTRGTTSYTIYTTGGDHRLGGDLDVTGNITLTGTVDGRDIASDGSTLDSHTSATIAHGVSGTLVGTTDTQTLTNKTLQDSTTWFADNVDSTKKLQLELSGITTSTTRTLTVPDANTTLVGIDTTDTLTNKTLTTPTIQTNLITTSSYIEIADISAPTNPGAGKGKIYKKTSNDGIFWKPDAAGAEIDLTTSGTTTCAIIRDQKSSATNGGTFTANSWVTRVLTNIVGTAYDSSDVTIATNQVTIKAGKYHVSAKSTAYRVDSHVLRFRNITDTSTAIEGMTSYSNSNSRVKAHNTACLEGYLNLGAQKTFELQHRCTSTRSNDGLGFAHGISGVNEIFTTVVIMKLE